MNWPTAKETLALIVNHRTRPQSVTAESGSSQRFEAFRSLLLVVTSAYLFRSMSAENRYMLGRHVLFRMIERGSLCPQAGPGARRSPRSAHRSQLRTGSRARARSAGTCASDAGSAATVCDGGWSAASAGRSCHGDRPGARASVAVTLTRKSMLATGLRRERRPAPTVNDAEHAGSHS
jgi:hypothetical protein